MIPRGRFRRPAIVFTALLTLGVARLAGADTERTLGQHLAEAQLDPSGLDTAELQWSVADFAVEQGAAHATFAFSARDQQGRTALHVRAREAAGSPWRAATFDAEALGLGAVMLVQRTGAMVLVNTALDERSPRTLVLDGALAQRRIVDGAILTVLPDDVVLFEDSPARFAPATPVTVSAYRPDTDELAILYPGSPLTPVRKQFVERVRRAYSGWGLKNCIAAKHHCNAEQFDAAIVSDLVTNVRATRIAWVMRFGPADTHQGPVDFSAFYVVTCERAVRGTTASCRERSFGKYDGRDGDETRNVLLSVVSDPRIP